MSSSRSRSSVDHGESHSRRASDLRHHLPCHGDAALATPDRDHGADLAIGERGGRVRHGQDGGRDGEILRQQSHGGYAALRGWRRIIARLDAGGATH